MRTPDFDGVTMTLDDQASSVADGREATELGLTILWHPDVARVGERTVLGRPGLEVSRLEPDFVDADGHPGGPLSDPYLSRKPIVITRERDGVRIAGSATVDGQPLDDARFFGADAINRGLRIDLARRVLLLLHRVPLHRSTAPRFSMVGESLPMRRLRAEIRRIAQTNAAVLVRGESGSGKELVARAVHEASRRADGPYRVVNVAAVPHAVAASSFFGHVRGAFSGADRDQPGYFGESDRGTLFLDEIGELPAELQPLLLRALESGDIQPVGAARSRRVDVRIIAATDAALEAAVDAGRFSVPLLHRLAGLELWIPPLRARVDDIPRLLIFGLRRELDNLGAADRLTEDPTARKPWLDAATVSLLIDHPWPGNVRELLNLTRQIAVSCHDRSRVRVSRVAALARIRDLHRSFAEPDSLSNADAGPGHTDSPDSETGDGGAMTVDGVSRALEQAGWSVHAAARALGVAKTSLYRFIEAHRLIRKATEIPDDELRAVYLAEGGDRAQMSKRLRVSQRALTFRLKEVDLPDLET